MSICGRNTRIRIRSSISLIVSNTHIFAILLLLGLVTFSSSAISQEESNPPAIETTDEAPTDVEIDERLEAIFNEIDGLKGVYAAVTAGVVTLRGEVSEHKLRQNAEQLASRVKGVVAVKNEIAEQTAVGERLVPILDRFEKRLIQTFNYLPLALIALGVWMITGIAGWMIASLRQPWAWLTPNTFISDLLRQLIRILFVAIGAVLALDILGATAVLGTILGAAGIVGLAIGFAVRDTVENYIASILLSVRQPFRPMEFVHIDGYEGHVIRLTSRATILMDVDGNHIRIPNSTVFKSKIVNYSRNPERRFMFELGVDADSILKDALAVCLEELRNLPFVLTEPQPNAWIEAVGDSNIMIGLSGWVNQNQTEFKKARSEAIRSVKNRLEENGFALPEPIYRLRIDGAASSGGAPDLASQISNRPVRKRAKPKKPREVPASARSSDEGEATDTMVDHTVIRKIAEERLKNENEDDLLSEDAPEEMR